MTDRNVTDRNGDHGNGNWSPFVGMSPLMRFIAIIGVPAAIALFMVWRVDGRQADQLISIDRQIQGLAIASSTVQRLSEDSLREQRSLTTLVRQICINTAKTDSQRLDCGR